MRKKRGFETWWYVALATAGALTIIVPTAYFGWRELAPTPQVGECVKQVDHGAAELKFEEVRCSERKRGRKSEREFEVGAIAKTCPPGDYTVVSRGDEKTCYLPTLNVGPCFVPKKFQNTDQPVLVRGDCKAPDARKAESTVQDQSDRSKCSNEELSLAFSEPARTICMEKP
jgi:hypothetical protein